MLYKCFWPSGFEMRSRLIFTTLVVLLLCSLGTLETTELLNLADDTSNDFSLLGSQQQTASAVVRESVEGQPRVVPPTDGSERPRVRRQAAGSSRPGKDFLHFLCIMRT